MNQHTNGRRNKVPYGALAASRQDARSAEQSRLLRHSGLLLVEVRPHPPAPCTAVEQFAIATKDFNPRTCRVNMPSDPRLRHNIIVGPSLASCAMHDEDKKPINIREKPAYLAQKIVEPYLQPLDWVIVPCAGACGECVAC